MLTKWQIEYKKYLESEHWNNLKKSKLNKVSNNCCYCWMTYNHIHHINYKKWYNVDTNDLRLVCSECHLLLHKLEKEWFIEYVYCDWLDKSNQSRYLKQKFWILKYQYWVFFRVYHRVNWYIKNILNLNNDWINRNDLFIDLLKKEEICKYQLNKKIQLKLI